MLSVGAISPARHVKSTTIFFTPQQLIPITLRMTTPKLTSKQIKFLRARAHALNPIVRIGQNGLSEAVLRELEIALTHHELVKIKVAANDREARESMLTNMRNSTHSQLVQRIGSIVVLYRQNVKKPVIDLSLANSN